MSVFSLTSVDFCVSDPLVIDMDTFHLWLEGASVHDAALALGTVDPVGPSSGAAPFGGGGGGVLLPAEWEQLVLADTSAQFRTFWALKPYLDEPQRLLAQRRFRIPPHLLQRVLDSYYSFDDRLMREALGRKPTPKLRRTLEAQCEKLNVSLPSCRRQADNLHRIYTSTDETDAGPASQLTGAAAGAAGGGEALVAHVRAAFLLSTPLAARYADLLFLCSHQLDTHALQLVKLSLPQLEALARVLLHAWTAAGSGPDLDPQFTMGLRQAPVTAPPHPVRGWSIPSEPIHPAHPVPPHPIPLPAHPNPLG